MCLCCCLILFELWTLYKARNSQLTNHLPRCLPDSAPSCQTLSLHTTLITDVLQKRILTVLQIFALPCDMNCNLQPTNKKWFFMFNEPLKLSLKLSCLDGLIRSSILSLWLSLWDNILRQHTTWGLYTDLCWKSSSFQLRSRYEQHVL